jgi:hypothetical protein
MEIRRMEGETGVGTMIEKHNFPVMAGKLYNS